MSKSVNFFTILTILKFLTIFDNFWQFSQFRQLLLPFWQLKRQSWTLVTFETLITILTIENLNSDNLCYLTINCDTGQHSQFLRCLSYYHHMMQHHIMICSESGLPSRLLLCTFAASHFHQWSCGFMCSPGRRLELPLCSVSWIWFNYRFWSKN